VCVCSGRTPRPRRSLPVLTKCSRAVFGVPWFVQGRVVFWFPSARPQWKARAETPCAVRRRVHGAVGAATRGPSRAVCCWHGLAVPAGHGTLGVVVFDRAGQHLGVAGHSACPERHAGHQLCHRQHVRHDGRHILLRLH